MRQLYYRSLVAVIAVFFLAVTALQAQVGIGTPFRTQTPNGKAVLHLESDAATPQGFLMPRLDRAKFVGLTSSDNGMVIYDQTDNQFYYWLNDRWTPLSGETSVTRDTWLSGTGSPDNATGKEGDFYFDLVAKDLYRKNSSGVYTKLFSFDSDRFWQSSTPLINTHTTRSVGIGVTNPTEKLEVNGSIVSTALKGTSNQVLLGDANGKIVPFSNAKGILTNDGSGGLTWEPLVGSNYTAGTGININNNVIENVGDTDPGDDITETSVADGEITGTYYGLTIRSGSISEDKISDGAVTEPKIGDGSITPAKIAPPPYGNMQLVTNASGVVTWVPSTSATLGTGEIAIGTGTNVNSVVPSQDISMNTNGQTTVLGLLGRPLDTGKTPFINQILTYNGSQWTYEYVDATTSASGDVNGLLNATTVQRIQNQPLDASLASLSGSDAAKVLTWDGSHWVAQNVPAFTLPNTDNGKILIGDGSTVNSVNVTGDISLANDGTTQLNNLQGKTVSASNPLTNQILRYNGSAWVPSDVLTPGDLEVSTNTLMSLQGRSVLASSPTLNNVLTWTGTAWEPKPIPTFSLPNTGSGEILVGNGSSVNTVTMSGDVYLDKNGTATTVGLLGRAMDNTNTPSVNQVMIWDGGRWTYEYIDGTTFVNGDVQGLLSYTTVTALQNYPVAVATPTTGDVLQWDGSQWIPYALTDSLNGDATGSLSAVTVSKIQGTNVDPNLASGLATDKVLTWDGTAGQWIAKAVTIPGVINTGVAEFAIGQGSNTAAKTITGDISIDANGQALVQNLANNPLDNTALSAADANKVLTWNGSQWLAQPSPADAWSETVNEVTLVNVAKNVGIGVTNPLAKLHVNGDVLSTKITTDIVDANVVNTSKYLTLGSYNSSTNLAGSIRWDKFNYIGHNESGQDVNLLATPDFGTVGQVLTSTGTSAQWQSLSLALPALNNNHMWLGGPGNTAVARAIRDFALTGSNEIVVSGLQGNPVSSQILSGVDNGSVLTWNGATFQWEPQLLNLYNATRLQGYPIAATAPTIGQTLTWNGTQWEAQTSPANAWTETAGEVTLTNTTKNVGIGTSTPSAKLHINGSVQVDGGDVSVSGGGGVLANHIAVNAVNTPVNGAIVRGTLGNYPEHLIFTPAPIGSDSYDLIQIPSYLSTSTPYATGDLIAHDGTTWNRLPRGNDGEVLKSTATGLQWGPALGGSITAGNGLTMSGSEVILGGTLNGPSTINLNSHKLTLANGDLDVQGSVASGWDVSVRNRLKIGARDISSTSVTDMPVHATTFQTDLQSETINYTLPAARPTANGQVLTSTTAGIMSWQTPSSGSSLWTPSGSDAYYSGTGNIGIGTTTPVAKLEVNGSFIASSVQANSVSTDFLYVNGSGGPSGSISRATNANYPDHLVFNSGSGYRDIVQIPVPTSPNYQAGDIIMHTGTDWNRLPRGTDGQFLKSTATSVVWDTPSGSLPTGTTNGQLLQWNGSSWIAQTVALPAVTDLESQSYTAAQTRYYSLDPVDFILINEKTSPDIVGVSGNYVRSNSSSGILAAGLHLPEGATVTNIRFLCYDNDNSKNLTVRYVKTNATGSSTISSNNTTGQSALAQSVTLATSDVIDNQTYSYKVIAEMESNDHRIYGVRVTYTITKPD